MKGERNGQPYRGLLYTTLDDNKEKAEVSPLKSSLFGKGYGFDALEKHMERSGERITKDNNREYTRHRVTEAMLEAPTENELRERLKSFHIDLFLRRNDTRRIVGVTFIDHENRCVLNGSRLGKEYSANALNSLYGGNQYQKALQDIEQKDLKSNLPLPSHVKRTKGKHRRRF